MSPASDPMDKNRKQYVFNITLAAVAGQVGCLTLFIILVALFGGLWLDNQFQSRPLFTVILTIASVPITLVVMFWVVKTATSRLQANMKNNQNLQEEANGGSKS